MIIAHLPAGYLYGYVCSKNNDVLGVSKAYAMFICCAGAIFPDLDMLYFYFVDNRQTHHHEYWTHLPYIWLTVAFVLTIARFIFGKTKKIALAGLFVGGVYLHLLLDSIVGDIWWLAPYIDKPYALFTVTARYEPWWLNFIIHWSFIIELLIWFIALGLFIKKRGSA